MSQVALSQGSQVPGGPQSGWPGPRWPSDSLAKAQVALRQAGHCPVGHQADIDLLAWYTIKIELIRKLFTVKSPIPLMAGHIKIVGQVFSLCLGNG